MLAWHQLFAWICRMLSSVIVLFIVIHSLLHHHEQRVKSGPLDIIGKLTKCAVIFASVELAKVVGCRMLSLRALSENVFVRLRVRETLSCMPQITCGCPRACITSKKRHCSAESAKCEHMYMKRKQAKHRFCKWEARLACATCQHHYHDL